jgi:hypothetical protein
MDNGLIFPYPCTAVHAGPPDAEHPAEAFGPRGAADQRGSRQARGVTQEGSSTRRWLSWGKGVGRGTGKSVPHEA